MHKDHDLLNELDALDIPEQPLSAGELDRLTRAVMDRVDTANAPAAAASGQKPKVRHIRRRAAHLRHCGRRGLRPVRHRGRRGAFPGADAGR